MNVFLDRPDNVSRFAQAAFMARHHWQTKAGKVPSGMVESGGDGLYLSDAVRGSVTNLKLLRNYR